MLIAVSLGVMLILTIFSVVAGASWFSLGVNSSLAGPEGMAGAGGFSIDPISGATGIIIVIVALGVIFGLRFFSSGLSDTSIRTLIIGLSYGSLWILFSVFAQPLLSDILIFGSLLYIILTIAFTIGVIQKITQST